MYFPSSLNMRVLDLQIFWERIAAHIFSRYVLILRFHESSIRVWWPFILAWQRNWIFSRFHRGSLIFYPWHFDSHQLFMIFLLRARRTSSVAMIKIKLEQRGKEESVARPSLTIYAVKYRFSLIGCETSKASCRDFSRLGDSFFSLLIETFEKRDGLTANNACASP